MQSITFMVFTFIAGNLAGNIIQLYCGNYNPIEGIRIQRVEEKLKGGLRMWAECRARSTPLIYSSSGEGKRLITFLVILIHVNLCVMSFRS